MNLNETIRTANKLPAFSRRVYVAILEGLYAEEFFSDLEGHEVAQAIDATPEAVGGAIKKLSQAGLVYVESTDVNGTPYRFIHAGIHDDCLRDEALEALKDSFDYQSSHPAPAVSEQERFLNSLG